MAVATDTGRKAGCFVVHDEGEHSRDNVVVLSGQTLKAGAVVGLVDIAGIGSASVPTVVGTGTGTMSLVTVGPLAQVGNYVVKCTAAATHGGVFSVTAPDGTVIGTITMTGGSGATTAFQSPHINFSLTDSTDFVVNDTFTIVVGTTAPTVIGGTGTGTISALSLGAKAQRGNYLVTITEVVANGGRFEVRAPDGSVVRAAAMNTTSTGAAAIVSDHINFTLTDATDFIAGNYFNVAVYGPAANPKAVEWDPYPTTYDGRHRVAGIAWDDYDASSADVRGVIEVRRAVVNSGELTWKTGLGAGVKASGTSALTARGVVVR